MSDVAFEFLKLTAVAVLQILELAFFVRSVLSLFDPMQEWRLSGFLFLLTEPVVLPIRALLAKLSKSASGGPIDIAYMITFLCLVILEMLVSTL